MSESKSVIELNDTPMSAMVKISEGNPGAATVLSAIMQHGATIDPDNAFGGLGSVLLLDTYGIRGSRIWILFKDVCRSNLPATILVLRASQLGFISQEDIHKAIKECKPLDNFQELITKVTKELPNFKLALF